MAVMRSSTTNHRLCRCRCGQTKDTQVAEGMDFDFEDRQKEPAKAYLIIPEQVSKDI